MMTHESSTNSDGGQEVEMENKEGWWRLFRSLYRTNLEPDPRCRLFFSMTETQQLTFSLSVLRLSRVRHAKATYYSWRRRKVAHSICLRISMSTIISHTIETYLYKWHFFIL